MTDTKEVRDDDAGASDAKGATEENMERITEIHGSEVLGYKGEGRGEHSGQQTTRDMDSMNDLADNQNVPKQ
ncbi:MAG TPA: hypothetical protein VJ276_06555 [Thermoanaerobaculia bacterium]|nr:hypothetical protein [Thermoanaerobaculia bacterium]